MKSSWMILFVGICLLGGCRHEGVGGGSECPTGTGCPPGYTCQNGYCVVGPGQAECDYSNLEYEGWPNDSDLEPNGHQDTAVVLPCGDDAVFTDPLEYAERCPYRESYTNGFMNLVTCPEGDQDFYAIYLLPDETVQFNLLYQWTWDPPRDLDARVWRWDFAANAWADDIAVGLSTNDNEELTVSTTAGLGNPQGWYYLEVFGKTEQDVNYYTISFTLNPATY